MTKTAHKNKVRSVISRENYDARRIIKINHSLLITIPVRFARCLNINAGDYLEVRLCRGSITLTPLFTVGKNKEKEI